MFAGNAVILAIVFLLGLNGCAGRIGLEASSENPHPIDALRNQLSSIRGLSFIDDVPVVAESTEGLKEYVDTDLQPNMRGKDLDDISAAYEKLGLLPHGANLRSGLLSFYSAEAMALYDSKTKRVVFVGNPSGRSDALTGAGIDEKVLVHELTHALQDQHFLVGDRLRHSNNGDASLALRSVAEGDAILTEYAFSFGGLNEWLPGYVARVFGGAGDDAAPSAVPMIVADKVRFQYLAGVRFVSHFLGKDGSLSVDLLYKYPPLSTEQILHPEKYLEAPDPPIRIELKGLSGMFSSEWREIENDTLGELMVQCLFKQFIGPEGAAAVAEGWGGDRFVAYRNGNEVAFVWATVWDSAKDAQEFYENYQKILSMKYGTPLLDSRSYIEKRHRSVMVVEGVKPERIKKNIDTLWVDMVTEQETFHPPPFGSSTASR
jgi:hypothetical protein